MSKIYRAIILFLGLFLAVNFVNAADYSEDFSGDLSNWSVIDLTGKNAPSKWTIGDGQLHQASNIGNGRKFTLKDHRGSILLFNRFSDVDFELKINFNSIDNDGVGFVFGYKDENNFYQIIISNEVHETILSKITNGQSAILAETDDTYIKKIWQNLRILSKNGQTLIYLNDKLISSTDFNQSGKVGLSVWANQDIYFDNFSVQSINTENTDGVIVAGVEYEEGASLGYQNKTLFKTERSPMVYFIVNNKRRAILNPEVFLDYGFNWDEVNLTTFTKLEKYPHAKVVKTENSPTVYYINEKIKKKKPILNAEIFLTYGNSWDDVITISQKDLDSYSDIRVIKAQNAPTIYELTNGVIGVIANPEEFETLGYQWNEIIIVKDIELDAYDKADDVIVAGVEYEEGEEDASDDYYLSVKTVKTIEEDSIPGGSLVSILELQLTSGLTNAVNVSNIRVTRAAGVTAIDKLIIVDSDDNFLGEGTFSASTQVDIKLYPELYIAPNSTETVKVKAVISQTDYVVYEQLSIQLEQDITTNAHVEGSFPVEGDRFKVIPANDLIGQAKISSVVVDDGLRSTYIGVKDQLITKFTFEETGGNEDIYLTKLKISNIGSSDAEFANVDLVDKNNKVVATTNPSDNNRKIVFDLTNVPYKIKKDSSHTFSLRTDITGGAGRSIKFVIAKETDVSFYGASYLFDLLIASDEAFPLGKGTGTYTNMVKINDADVMVYKNSSSPVADLVAGSSNQVLGIFDLEINGFSLIYQAVTLQIINGGNVDLTGDLTIRDHKTKQILGQADAGLASGRSRAVGLTHPVEIQARQTFTFDVLVNVNSKATLLDTYQIKIISMDFQTPRDTNAYHFDYETYSNTLGVKTANLAIMSDTSAADQEVSADKTNVFIGSFALQAGIAEDLIVNTFNIQEVADYGIIDYSGGYSNLKIKVNGNTHAAFSAPIGGPFVVSKPFTLAAGKTVSIKAYVDVNPLVDTDQIKLAIYDVNAVGKSSGSTPDQTGGGAQSFVTAFTQNRLRVAKNSNMDDTTIIAGNGSQKVASFNLENLGIENIRVKNFTLTETDSSAEISYNNGYSALKVIGVGAVTQPIASGNKFGGFTVKAGETKILDVYITPDDSTVNDEFVLILKDVIVDGGIDVDGDSVVGQDVRVAAAE